MRVFEVRYDFAQVSKGFHRLRHFDHVRLSSQTVMEVEVFAPPALWRLILFLKLSVILLDLPVSNLQVVLEFFALAFA